MVNTMKVGICTNFLSEDKYSLHTEQLETLAEIFDFVEFPAFPIAALSDEAFAEFAEFLAQKGIRCDCITNLFPTNLHLMAEPLDVPAITAYLDALLPRLKRMGCRKLVFGSGPARSVPEGMAHEAADCRMIRILQELVIPAAQLLGMEVLLEPLNPILCNYMHTIGEAAPICEACADAVGIVADSFNLMENEKTQEQILRHSHRIRHVHISEAKRICPKEPLSLELTRFISALNVAGYTGSVSLECKMSGIDMYRNTKELVFSRFDHSPVRKVL